VKSPRVGAARLGAVVAVVLATLGGRGERRRTSERRRAMKTRTNVKAGYGSGSVGGNMVKR
jgi:hypothetical protein